MDTVEVKLSAPVTAHGTERASLSFRKPTGKDIRECGSPMYNFQQNGLACNKIDTGAVSDYISRLANIPPSTVDKLSPEDWMTCSATVVGFFTPSESIPAKPSTGTGNSDASSET